MVLYVNFPVFEFCYLQYSPSERGQILQKPPLLTLGFPGIPPAHDNYFLFNFRKEFIQKSMIGIQASNLGMTRARPSLHQGQYAEYKASLNPSLCIVAISKRANFLNKA